MKSKIYIIIILMLVLVIVVFVVLKNKQSQKKFPTPTDQTILKLEAEKKNIATLKSLNQVLDKAKLLDTDLDGLSNEEEKKLGTDPNNPDTDGDGLLDGDEVKIFHTNPLKADTDGDSYKDGYEVRRGYNPLGSGKLIK